MISQCSRYIIYCDLHTNVIDSPVVPAGEMFLKHLTTSSLPDRLASLAKQRIQFLVSSSGFSREAWGLRLPLNWFTISLESHDCDKRDFLTTSDKEIALSSFPTERCILKEFLSNIPNGRKSFSSEYKWMRSGRQPTFSKPSSWSLSISWNSLCSN